MVLDGGPFGLRIVFTYKHQTKSITFDKSDVIVGRTTLRQPVDLDLSPDESVSRKHARIWIDNAEVWVNDLRSKSGTLINGMHIYTPERVDPNDSIVIGSTTLFITRLAPLEVFEAQKNQA